MELSVYATNPANLKRLTRAAGRRLGAGRAITTFDSIIGRHDLGGESDEGRRNEESSHGGIMIDRIVHLLGVDQPKYAQPPKISYSLPIAVFQPLT